MRAANTAEQDAQTIVVAMYHVWYAGPQNSQERGMRDGISWLTRPIGFPQDRRVSLTPMVCDELNYLAPKEDGGAPLGYHSADPRVIERHCRWAKEAGIDAFAIQTMTEDVWFTRNNMPRVVAELNRQGMAWFPLFDEGGGEDYS